MYESAAEDDYGQTFSMIPLKPKRSWEPPPMEISLVRAAVQKLKRSVCWTLGLRTKNVIKELPFLYKAAGVSSKWEPRTTPYALTTATPHEMGTARCARVQGVLKLQEGLLYMGYGRANSTPA